MPPTTITPRLNNVVDDTQAQLSTTRAETATMRARHEAELAAIHTRLENLKHEMRASRIYDSARNAGALGDDNSIQGLARRITEVRHIMNRMDAPPRPPRVDMNEWIRDFRPTTRGKSRKRGVAKRKSRQRRIDARFVGTASSWSCRDESRSSSLVRRTCSRSVRTRAISASRT